MTVYTFVLLPVFKSFWRLSSPDFWNQGCAMHCYAFPLSSGVGLSINLRRLMQWGERCRQVVSIIKSILSDISLFLIRSSSIWMSSPCINGIPATRPKKTLPILNMSDFRVSRGAGSCEFGLLLSIIGGFKIYGSMNPGVPHSYLVNDSSVIKQAMPKSARQTFLPPRTLFELLMSILSGFISRWTINFRCMSAMASRSWWIIGRASSSEIFYSGIIMRYFFRVPKSA